MQNIRNISTQQKERKVITQMYQAIEVYFMIHIVREQYIANDFILLTCQVRKVRNFLQKFYERDLYKKAIRVQGVL